MWCLPPCSTWQLLNGCAACPRPPTHPLPLCPQSALPRGLQPNILSLAVSGHCNSCSVTTDTLMLSHRLCSRVPGFVRSNAGGAVFSALVVYSCIEFAATRGITGLNVGPPDFPAEAVLGGAVDRVVLFEGALGRLTRTKGSTLSTSAAFSWLSCCRGRLEVWCARGVKSRMDSKVAIPKTAAQSQRACNVELRGNITVIESSVN